VHKTPSQAGTFGHAQALKTKQELMEEKQQSMMQQKVRNLDCLYFNTLKLPVVVPNDL